MKKTRFIIALVAAMFAVGAMLFVACKKERVVSTNDYGCVESVKSVSSIDFGRLHNDILLSSIIHFDTNIVFDSVPEVVDYANAIIEASINELDLDVSFKEELISHCSVFKDFVSLPDLYDSLFSGDLSLKTSIEKLYFAKQIGDDDKAILEDVSGIIEQSYHRSIGNDEALDEIQSYVRMGKSKTQSQVANVIYDIAEASIMFWKDYGETPQGNHPCYLPPQAVADIGGAIVGAAVSVGIQSATNGKVDVGGAAASALASGVSASVGAPAKVGKAVCKAAVKAGKYLGKLLHK